VQAIVLAVRRVVAFDVAHGVIVPDAIVVIRVIMTPRCEQLLRIEHAHGIAFT
jgi:hypothetical protein